MYFFNFIEDYFLDCLVNEYADQNIERNFFSINHIEKMITNKYKKKIKIVCLPYKGKLIAAKNVSTAIVDDNFKDNDILQRAAMLLRKHILQIKPNKLGDKITASDLMRGECDLSKTAIDFFTLLISGFDYRRKKSANNIRLAESFTSDVTYAITAGRVKPAKHISLGSTVKSLTNSRKVIEILNAYGHVCGYDTLLALETEATYSISEAGNMCPSDIIREKNLRTVTVFDNFDRFIDTPTGKSTLNDTVGIAIQDIKISSSTQSNATSNFNADDDSDLDVSSDDILNDPEVKKKRRKSFKGFISEIPPYTKKTKITYLMKPFDYHSRVGIPQDLSKARKLDCQWILSQYFNLRPPMWVGFNAKFLKKKDMPKQFVSYMTPINESPTQKAVVLETMRRAMRVAAECDEIYGQVTYDLGIAKIAYPIQNTEKDEFKNLFIHLGGFHIEKALFKAIGTYIDGCGLTTVMVEAGFLGSGSLNTFLSGNHFNRCKRLHILVSLSLQVREFEMFLTKTKMSVSNDVIDYLHLAHNKPLESLNTDNSNLEEIINQFQAFHQEILSGYHGKTAQYYATYIQLMNYYFIFERSIRTCNLDLYCYVIGKINNIFFTFNHINYSRWLAWYHNALLNMDETHPGIREILVIGVGRTKKPFSSIPCDLTLEQTINADAARRLTGIMHLTNSISARTRWSLNHAMRSSLISHTLQQCGLKKPLDITNDLLKSRINISQKKIEKFLGCLNLRMNPFLPDIQSDLLFNISTGKAAPEEVSHFLLNVENAGEHQRKSFIDHCSTDENNFDKYKFKKNKILNFSSCTQRKRSKVSDKVKEVTIQRDLFGRLLGISVDEKIDIEKVLLKLF